MGQTCCPVPVDEQEPPSPQPRDLDGALPSKGLPAPALPPSTENGKPPSPVLAQLTERNVALASNQAAMQQGSPNLLLSSPTYVQGRASPVGASFYTQTPDRSSFQTLPGGLSFHTQRPDRSSFQTLPGAESFAGYKQPGETRAMSFQTMVPDRSSFRTLPAADSFATHQGNRLGSFQLAPENASFRTQPVDDSFLAYEPPNQAAAHGIGHSGKQAHRPQDSNNPWQIQVVDPDRRK